MSTRRIDFSSDPNFVPTLLIVFCSMLFGLVPVFAKTLVEGGLAPPVVAFFRYGATALVMLPMLDLRRRSRSTTLIGIGTGAILGLGWIGYVAALDGGAVATVGVLYMTYPLFTLAVGLLLFGERPARVSILAGCLILFAAFLAVGTDGSLTPRQTVMALFAPLTFGIAINALTHKLAAIPPLARMASVTLGSSLCLIPLVASYPIAEITPTGAQWLHVLALAVLTALLPQYLYSVNAPKVGAARAAMAGSAELPTAFVMGWLFFGETIGVFQILAGGLVLTAICISPARPPAVKPR